MTLEEYQEFRRVNYEKFAQFSQWVDEMVNIGPSYAHFQSAQFANKQFKKVQRELKQLGGTF